MRLPVSALCRPCESFPGDGKMPQPLKQAKAEVEAELYGETPLNLDLTLNLVRGVGMPNATLLYSPTCGACPTAKSLSKPMRVSYSITYPEVVINSPVCHELAV